MALYEVFSHSDRFHYRANLFSLATCFVFLCAALTFLPPFLFAYFAGGFWTKESSYSEQPRVNYSSQYILIMDTANQALPFYSSSYASLNSLFQNAFIPGTCTFLAIDNNNDEVTDQFSISLQFSYTNDIQMNNVNLWLIFQYELRARQAIYMETMLLINLFPPNAIALSSNPSVFTAGQLVLEQRQPIQSSGTDLSYNQSIIDLNNLFTTSSLGLNSVLNNYFIRNYYTSYQSEYVKWQPGTAEGTNILTVNVTIDIVSQSIRFIPGFWQEFKWGWIQYLSVLLPFIYFFNYIKEFVFRHRLVRTLVELPHHRHKDK
jgi:transmembrane protein 231